MRSRITSTFAVVAFLVPVAAYALDLADPDWRWNLPEPLRVPHALTFRALDIDGDQALTPQEASANPIAAAHFARADLDANGRLSPLEYNNLALLLSRPARTRS